MIALVTGAAGFLGRRLVCALLDKGDEVRGIVRKRPVQDFVGQKLSWIERDLSIEGPSHAEVNGVDVVFHLAATIHSDDERRFISNNEMATINLLNCCAGKVDRIVHVSSQVVYGDVNSLLIDERVPLDGSASAYACSKVNAENWLQWFYKKTGVKGFLLRMTGFIEDGSVVNYFIDRALLNEPIELYSRGKVFRDYLAVSDAIQALLLTSEYNGNLDCVEAFNIGSGQRLTTEDLARIVCEETRSASRIVPLGEPAPKSNFIFDISKARALLGFCPGPLDMVVRTYVRNRMKRSEYAR